MTFRKLLPVALMIALITSLHSEGSAQLFWNQAARFAGSTSSYVAIPHSSSLNLTGSFTIECWVHPANVLSPPFQTIVNKRLGSASEGYNLKLSNGRVSIRTNTTTRLNGATVIPNNVWTHIAATYNASTNVFTVYVDGLADGSVTIAGAAPNPSADSLTVGKGFNSPFAGYIDEVRIWNRALSGAELRRNHRSSIGISSGVYNGLVLSLGFQDDESSGGFFNLIDWSANGNSGVNRGVAPVDLSMRPPTYLAYNQAIELDGTDDYLAGRDFSAVSPTAAITMEAWVYPRSEGTAVIINKGLSSTTPSYRLLLTSSANVIRAGINGNFVSSAARALVGRWTHVAFTYTSSGGQYRFYVNGEEAGSGTLPSGAINDGTDSLLIGGGLGLVDFNGFIDEVRISNYVKTEDEIRRFLFRSIDDANEPNDVFTNVSYNLDGYSTDACIDGGPRLQFRGTAILSNPGTMSNRPVAPLNRLPGQNYADGFYMKTTDRRIPETGTSGLMRRDSIFVNQSVTISDINLFLATNHTFDADLEIALFAPNGDSVGVIADYRQIGSNDNIITVLDDNADSSASNNLRYTAAGPTLKPENSMNSIFSGDNAQGWWILHIRDDAALDTGRLYAWGIQINNQVLVGVEEIASEVPLEFKLLQNYPNPFNPTTSIEFAVPKQSLVKLKIYDILGREVATLVNEEKMAGTYKAEFNAAGYATGAYFYRLEAGGYVETRKMLLLK